MGIDDIIDTSSSRVTGLVFVLITVCIYIPLASYHGYKYYKQRNNIIMKKRYSSIMIYEIMIIIIKMLIDATRDTLKLVSISIIPIDLIADLFYDIMVSIWLWRFWCLHFDLNWTHFMLNQKWKCIINEQFVSHNFYILKKSSFGNKHWIFKSLILPLIIFTFITTDILQLILTNIMSIDDKTVNTVKLCCLPIYIGPAILLMIIYYKIPKFRDNFFIKKELRLLLITILMMYISYWSYYFLIQFNQNIDNKIIIKYIHPISTFAVVFCDFLCLMISTFLVNKKVKKIIMNKKYSINDQNKDVPLIQIRLLSSDYDNENTVSTQTQQKINLQCILADYRGVDGFMQHLQSELSTENLLCFIEFNEFQKYIVINNYSNHNNEISKKLIYEKVKFCGSIPNSLIVFDLNDDIKSKAIKLYNKYIEENCEYEINIPYRVRLRFSKWIKTNDNDNDDLINILDSCLEEIWTLLNHTFYRFQRSSSYKTLSHQILQNLP